MLISRPLESKSFSHRYLAGVIFLLCFLFHYDTCFFMLFRSSIVIDWLLQGKAGGGEHKDIGFNIL